MARLCAPALLGLNVATLHYAMDASGLGFQSQKRSTTYPSCADPLSPLPVCLLLYWGVDVLNRVDIPSDFHLGRGFMMIHAAISQLEK